MFMKRLLVVLSCVLGVYLFGSLMPINSQTYSNLTLESELRGIRQSTSRIQKMDAAFQLYSTQNHSTLLMLDTRDGRIWQVHWSIKEDSYTGTIPINSKSLAGQNKPGRFTLYPTTNVWNFILLDQDNGRTWQCQFAVNDPKARFIQPINTSRKY